MENTTEALRRLLDKHPQCRVCEDPSITVRERGNPKWGFEADGFTPRRDIADWLASGPDPDTIEGVCLDHLDTVRRGDGGWYEDDRTTPVKGWPAKRRAEKARVRAELIATLGGRCNTCGQQDPPAEMRVRVSGRVRHELGISELTEWYRYLQAHPKLLAQAELLCLSCSPDTHRTGTLDARQRVVEAYGKVCAYPDCGRDDNLAVTALPGTVPLVWPSGAKYNSVAKYQWLVRQNFPSGWTLACPAHLYQVRGGM